MQLTFLSRRFILSALLTIGVGILQSTGILAIANVKPNLLLVTLVALAFFFRDWTLYVSLLSIALFFVRSEAGFQSPYLVLAILSGTVFLFKEYFPWSYQFLNIAVGISLSTVLLYVLTDFSFIFNDPFTLIIEVIYNVLIGALIHLALKHLIGYETQFRASR